MSKNAIVEVNEPEVVKELTAINDAIGHGGERGRDGCACTDDMDHGHRHGALESPACSCHKPVILQGHAGEHDHDHGEFSWTWHIIVPGALFAAAMAGRMRGAGAVGTTAPFIVLLVSYVLCGLPVLREAVRSVRRGDFFNEFTLMSIASLVAIAIGESAEAVGVMLFYSLGEAVQEKAAGKSRRSIRALLASKPESANVLKEGKVSVVPPEQVAVGSRVLVKPGEKIPLDGLVVSGRANLDLSSLTGESLPVAVETEGRVYSGAICLDGDLVIETTAGYKDSMVGKILAMVENAVAMKSRTERFITVFARYYTPIVALAALLVATIPPLLFGAAWSVWIYRALVLLVVSCPCALLLSVPLAFFAGIGAASRRGMLVKGGQVFDALARATTVVFDKTGTLTEGKLSLTSVTPAPGVAESEVLRLAAAAESRSNHPVAKAVMAAAGEGATVLDEITIRDVAGKGIVARNGQDEILVGNAKLMADYGIAVGEDGSSDLAAYAALNGEYRGRLAFEDRLKRDTVEAVHRLRSECGVKSLHMLTGDRAGVAESVAREIGLDGFRAGLLPDEKVAAFRELSPAGDAVFVGDGVNDAPVLAVSGAGVAMGALGSAAAVEAADAVLLDDSPARLPELFRIAGRTRRIAGENIALAFLVKAAVMVVGVAGIGVLGIPGLWLAVFADVGVALLAVANSMRLTRG